MRNLLAVTSVLLLLALGCAPAGEAPAPAVDLEVERASLMQADQAWYEAYSASDNRPETFVGLLEEDAYLLPPDAPMAQGKADIGAIIAMLEATPGFSITWSPSVAEVGNAGDMGFTVGIYEIQMEDPEVGPVRIVGKYTTVWRKQPDGTWMVAVDMFNPDGPPSPIEE